MLVSVLVVYTHDAQKTVMTRVDVRLAGSLHGSALPPCQHMSESSTLCDEYMYKSTNTYAKLPRSACIPKVDDLERLLERKEVRILVAALGQC